jgi:addiction module HigA family antidote
MDSLLNRHPGKVLFKEFLQPMNISAYRLSKDIGIPQTRTSEIIKGVRRITADTALRLGYYFGNSPKFWLGIQNDYDIDAEMRSRIDEYKRIGKAEQRVAHQAGARHAKQTL